MDRNPRLKSFLQNEIRMRYAPDSILDYDDNKILHRFVDPGMSGYDKKEAESLKIMNQGLVQMSKSLLTTRRVAINGLPESFTCEMTQNLLDELDIRPTAEDLQKIKNAGLKLCVVGYGGAMINMLYNMHLWSSELSVTKPFEKLVVFEKDSLDFSNLPRIGKPVVHQYHPDFLQPFDESVPNLKTLAKKYLIDVESQLSKDQKVIAFQSWLDEEASKKIEEKGYIFVGAPTLDTRVILEDKNFYFMGHGDHEVEISYQPRITSGLANETYGSIDIPVLLINLQIATASFIKELARVAETGEKPDGGENIFTFDMKQYVERGEHV